MKEEITVGLHNKWEVIVRDAKTLEEKYRGVGENIILNTFFNYYPGDNLSNIMLNSIAFGSGTATPVATDTSLTSLVGIKGATTVGTDTSKLYTEGLVTVQKSCRLEANEHNGNTISEVGFSAYISYANRFMTKALLKDMNGNPLTIPKTDTVVIDIYGTFYFKFGLDKVDANKFIIVGSPFWCNGQFRDYLGASYVASAYSLKAPTYGGGGITLSPVYDNGNRRLICNIADAATAAHNYVGVGIQGLFATLFRLRLPCTGYAQPVIIKEVVGTGDGTKTKFKTKFPYIRDNGTFHAYVNDVEVDATALFGYPVSNNMMYNFRVPEFGASLGSNPGSSAWVTFENIYNDVMGVKNFTVSSWSWVDGSANGVDWTRIINQGSSGGTVSLAVGNQFLRWYRYSNGSISGATADDNWANNGGNVELALPATNGDTVTVTYQPDCIAKDDQHTLKNVSVTINFAEYTP